MNLITSRDVDAASLKARLLFRRGNYAIFKMFKPHSLIKYFQGNFLMLI